MTKVKSEKPVEKKTEVPTTVVKVVTPFVAEVAVEKIYSILPGKCKLLQHAHNTHCATVEKYLTIKQLENPELWAHVAVRMEHLDRLQVTAKDGSMIAFGLVTFVQGLIIKVKFYEHFDLDTVAQPEIRLNGYIIRQINSVDGWEVVSEAGEVLKDKGLPTQTAAVNYLQDHFKANAA